MISSVNSSVSALHAADRMLEVSAHNVANANTDGFKSSVASAQEDINGGVKVTISQNTRPGTVYNTGDGKLAESSNTDYAREAVDQISARAMFAANVASLKTYGEMYKSIIDIIV